MEIFVTDTYEDLSKQAADDLVQLLQSKKYPLLCTASGDTPAGLYKNLVGKFIKKELDTPDWYFIGLDEWTGLNGQDEGSCRFHLNNQLFRPLQVADDKIFFFDGRATDLDKECKDAENFIIQRKGIDISILGLGMNGHIGMNEPGTSPSLRSHVTALDPITQKTGQKYFKEQQQLTDGITLGLATLLESRYIFLLVSGSHKAGIVKKVLEDEVSEQLPGSLLRQHPGLKIYLDKEAAKLIQSKKV
jgi:galactosamine-6-phosphate isomerase